MSPRHGLSLQLLLCLPALAFCLLLSTAGPGCSRTPLEDSSLACNAGEEVCDGTCVPVGTCHPAGSGGAGGAGGATGSGGAAPNTMPTVQCNDSASLQRTMSTRFDGALIDVSGSDKQYFVQSNWTSLFSGQAVNVNGLSFSVGNAAGAKSSDSNPMGFPSFWMGAFAGITTRSSNLPKQVSALTGVPTRLVSNSNSMGTSNYNVAYEVWFAPSSAALPSKLNDAGAPCQCDGTSPSGTLVAGCGQIICGSDFMAYQCGPASGAWTALNQPGSTSSLGAGGAYLMVWSFKPSDRQPRGTLAYPKQTVTGLPGTWDVWVEAAEPPRISYVSTTPYERLEFDLNNVIQHAVQNSYGITKSMYLVAILGGFQVWGGGDGLQLKSFCANVL